MATRSRKSTRPSASCVMRGGRDPDPRAVQRRGPTRFEGLHVRVQHGQVGGGSVRGDRADVDAPVSGAEAGQDNGGVDRAEAPAELPADDAGRDDDDRAERVGPSRAQREQAGGRDPVRPERPAHHGITGHDDAPADLLGDPGRRTVADDGLRGRGGRRGPVAIAGRMPGQRERHRPGSEQDHHRAEDTGHPVAPRGRRPPARGAARASGRRGHAARAGRRHPGRAGRRSRAGHCGMSPRAGRGAGRWRAGCWLTQTGYWLRRTGYWLRRRRSGSRSTVR